MQKQSIRSNERRSDLARLPAAGKCVSLALGAAACLVFWSMAGCSDGHSGRFQFQIPQSDTQRAGQRLEQDFHQGYCRREPDGQLYAIWVADPPGAVRRGDESRPVRQMLVIRSFWLPGGNRMVSRQSATNVNLEYIVDIDGQIAWYRGSGFARFAGKRSGGDQKVDLTNSLLQIHRSSPTFPITFTQVHLTGSARCTYDPANVGRFQEILEEKIRRLPEPRPGGPLGGS
ncbi:MAG: hypothetical protein JW810_07165 [Sedimentisphaerales bacterium]|nr:hypothetical protein [Sedimentisphaerales bacterium]